MNLQPSQFGRLIGMDVGSGGVDDGSGPNCGHCARNVAVVTFKVGAGESASTEGIGKKVDYQELFDSKRRNSGPGSGARPVNKPHDPPPPTHI